MYDEILEQETRERLQEMDLHPDDIEMQLADMRDEGIFDYPDSVYEEIEEENDWFYNIWE